MLRLVCWIFFCHQTCDQVTMLQLLWLPLCGLLLCLVPTVAVASSAYPCGFAQQFTNDMLMHNVSAQEDFLDAMIQWEGTTSMVVPSVGSLKPFTQELVTTAPPPPLLSPQHTLFTLVLDSMHNLVPHTMVQSKQQHGHGCGHAAHRRPPAGFALDDASGKLTGSAWNWTSPAKESVHISLLALAINDTITQECAASRACRLVGSKQAAIDVLERKLTSMEGFNKRFPGYGGFLPWVLVGDNGLVPALDWLHSVPGLDNGINTHSLSLSLVRTAQPHVLGHLAWRGQVKWCGAWWRPHVPW